MSEHDIDEKKREFLKHMMAASAVMGVPGCSLMPVPYGSNHDPIIDAHAHIFNNRDFQQMAVMVYVYVTVFSEEVVFSDFLDALLRRIGRATGNTIERILEGITPSYREETEKLRRELMRVKGYDPSSVLANTIPANSLRGQVGMVQGMSPFDDEDYSESDYLDFYEKSKDRVLKPEGQSLADESEDIKVIKNYIRYKKLKQAEKRGVQKAFLVDTKSFIDMGFEEWDVLVTDSAFDEIAPYDDSINDVASFDGITATIDEVSKYIDYFLKIKALIEFMIATFRTHLGNARCLYRRFDDTEWFRTGKDGVDHFVTASVDMDHWVNSAEGQLGKPSRNHSLRQQYALIEKTAIVMQGRILPMVAFDPWREVVARHSNDGSDSPLELLKLCIKYHGFVGVKIYPPMGFAPYGNSEFDDWPAHKPKDIDDFGEKLDEVMLEFFDFCVAEDVPIMAHANESMHTQPGYSYRASPEAWKRLLSYEKKDGTKPYTGLRLNLGHAGGLDEVAKGCSDWVKGLVKLTLEYDNVYMDYSNYDGIHEDELRGKFVKQLRKLTRKTKLRMMYGSDWYMLAKYDQKHRYLAHMLQVANRLGKDAAPNFMGLNCLRFLGLDDEGTKAGIRLQKFYSRHGIATPSTLFRKTSMA